MHACKYVGAENCIFTSNQCVGQIIKAQKIYSSKRFYFMSLTSLATTSFKIPVHFVVIVTECSQLVVKFVENLL